MNYHLPDGASLLTDEIWMVLEHLNSFLEVFYEATLSASTIYEPTSCSVIQSIYLIAQQLRAHDNDIILHDAVSHMKAKYLKYWKDIPYLFSFAFMLDPRAKSPGLCNLLQLFTEVLGIDYSTYFRDVKNSLNDLYIKYEEKYAGVRPRRPPQAPKVGTKMSFWKSVMGKGASSSDTSHDESLSTRGTSGELAAYLSKDTVDFQEEEFHILTWWQQHNGTYPVLSILARDVLSVPVSTVSSESAFNLVGRILEDRRTSLHSDMVEILLSTKDWTLAEKRLQNIAAEKRNQELVATFENLNLDEEDP